MYYMNCVDSKAKELYYRIKLLKKMMAFFLSNRSSQSLGQV